MPRLLTEVISDVDPRHILPTLNTGPEVEAS